MGRGGNPSASPCPEIMLRREEGSRLPLGSWALGITDSLFERWKEYSEECHRNMSRLPAPTGEKLVCNRTFDKFSCWPDALPNSTASVPCPWFLPWYQKGNGWGGARVHVCTPDPCLQAAAGCRTATVFMQYGIVANYCWLLVEGIYLHNLLVVAVFSERSYFTLYLCIGWGAPVLFLIPWVVVKFLYENIQCWTTNNNMGFWWILRFPVFLAILINFFIFIRIIQILVSKLRAHQMRYTDYKFRLAKSTLTLIPLLGIHEVVFAFVTDEHAQGTLRYVKLFFDLFLSSFQGMLVAILYCFVNKEVSRMAREWGAWAAAGRGPTLTAAACRYRQSC
uniref:Glucagon receptor n=1 Tax=Buteo japonicus TaxID=224669 RepID=A0A8C0BXT0_9AVES